MTELYGRYHGQILSLARASTADGAWRAKLREILAAFDRFCPFSVIARYQPRGLARMETVILSCRWARERQTPALRPSGPRRR
jgi:hypothetical protein